MGAVILIIIGIIIAVALIRGYSNACSDRDRFQRQNQELERKIKSSNEEASHEDTEKYEAKIAEYQKRIQSLIKESNAQSKDIKLIQANYDELISDCQYELDQSQALNDKYLRKIEELTKQVKNLEERLNNSTQVCNDLTSECAQAIEREKQNRQELVLSRHLDKLKESPLFAPETMKRFCDAIKDKRFVNSFDPNISIQSDFNVSCEINSSGTIYKTSLYSCTCEDYLHRKRVCKHMLYLAASCGVMYFFGENQSEMLKDIRAYAQVAIEHESKADSAWQKVAEEKKQLKSKKEDLVNREKVLLEQAQTYPWLADLLARYQREVDTYRESLLPSSAWKSAKIVKEIKREKKELKIQYELLHNQLDVYESMFPWLEEFKLLSNQEIVQYASRSSDKEYNAVRNWLSPDEYAKLTDREKNQLALDRYNKRQKTDWEAGIEYERYIGYLCETKGGTVTYTGARNGLNDLGRDLVVTLDKKIYVIQCKRWSSKKQIHEKHIFQLFGTCILMKVDKSVPVIPVFVTTTVLSDTAKECAKELNITVFEQIPLHKYPQIKCNINHATGEKIYHLPFDQQYDTIVIEPGTGEFYAQTAEEAENHGFRRAFKHMSAI